MLMHFIREGYAGPFGSCCHAGSFGPLNLETALRKRRCDSLPVLTAMLTLLGLGMLQDVAAASTAG